MRCYEQNVDCRCVKPDSAEGSESGRRRSVSSTRLSYCDNADDVDDDDDDGELTDVVNAECVRSSRRCVVVTLQSAAYSVITQHR